jgi:hypothetical protein
MVFSSSWPFHPFEPESVVVIQKAVTTNATINSATPTTLLLKPNTIVPPKRCHSKLTEKPVDAVQAFARRDVKQDCIGVAISRPGFNSFHQLQSNFAAKN